MVGQALGGLGGGSFGRNVIGQAVIEVLVDNSGVERSLTNTQKLVAGMAVAGLGAAVSAAMAFESAMAQVEKTSGLSGAALDALGKEFRSLATNEIPMSASALAEIGAMAAQMGVEADSIGVFTEAVAKLATATDIVGDQGAASLARFINVMGDSFGNIDRVSSALVDLGNNTAATESEILELALRLAAAGRQLGMSTGEVLGLAAAMRDLGIPAEMGGTAMSRVLLEIYSAAQKGGEELAAFSDVAGMTSDQFRALLDSDPSEALRRFIGGMGEAEAQGHNIVQLLDDLEFGNVRVRDTLLRLTGSQEKLTEAMGRGSEAYAENTALQKEFEVFAGTTANQLRMLWNQITELGLALGSSLLPAMRAVVGVGIDVVAMFSSLPPGVQTAAIAFVTLSSLLPVVTRLFAALTAQMAATGAGMAAAFGPAGIAVAAAAIVAALVLNMEDLEGIAAALAPTMNRTAESVERLRDEAGTFAGHVTDAARELQRLADSAARLKDITLPPWAMAMLGITEAAADAADKVGALEIVWRGLSRTLIPVVGGIENAADALGHLNDVIGDTTDSQSRMTQEMADSLEEVLRYETEHRHMNATLAASKAGMDTTADSFANLGDWARTAAFDLAQIGPQAIAAAAALDILRISMGSQAYGRAGGRWARPSQVTEAREMIDLARRQVEIAAQGNASLRGLTDLIMRGTSAWEEYGPAARSAGAGSRAAAAGMSEAEKEAEALREEAIRAAEAIRDMDSRARANLIATQLWAAGYRDVETAIAAIHPVALRMLGDLQAQEEFIAAVTEELVGLKEEAQKLTAQQYAQQIATEMLAAGYVSVEAALAAVGFEARNHIATLQRQEGFVRDLTEALLGLSMGAERAKEQLAQLTGETISELDTLGSLIVTALRRQREAEMNATIAGIQRMRDAQLDAHNARIAQINRELNAQLSAIDQQIAALQGESEDERLKSLHEQIEELRKAEALAWDPRERKRIQDQIAGVERQITQFHREQEIARLRDSQQTLRDRARSQQEAAEAELAAQMAQYDRQEEAARNHFEAITQTWRLESEAREMITRGELDRISSLIQQYVPEWARSWQSFGESVVNGPLASIRGEITRIMTMMADMRSLQAAAVAPPVVPAPPVMSYADQLNAAWAPLAKTAPEFVVKDWRKQVVLAGGVPTFDTGAVLTAPTLGLLAMGSQAQPEIVTPERLMADVFRGVLDEHGTDRPIELHSHLYLDGREIDSRIERYDQWQQTTGARLQRGR